MFTYKGIHGSSMHIYPESSFTFRAPERDLTFIEVPGKDGDVIIDNGRFKAVDFVIPARLRLPEGMSLEAHVIRIRNWLATDVGYHDLLLDGDDDFVYRAIVTTSHDIDRVLKNYGRMQLTFRLHPIKYLKEGLEEQIVENGDFLFNPFQIVAKPRLKIIGSGRVIHLTIGNSELMLRGIDDGCIVDSERQTITSLDGQRTLFDKMLTHDFPVIEPASQMITYSGADIVTIETRIGGLV